MRMYHATGGPAWQGGRFLMTVVGLVLLCCQIGWASSLSPSTAEPPVFTHKGEKIAASLLPRAKSTPIRMTFGAAGGRLAAVAAKPFEEAARPEVDKKDFKSGLFVIQVVNLPVGASACVAIASDFFSSSTEYWIFNAHRAAPWAEAQILNQARDSRVRELTLTVTDGGPSDSDNAADGCITLVGGPKDSFWGYALGTLLIRFFGIFLVLSILMIGMLCSGKIFEKLEARKARARRQDRKSGSGQVPPEGHSANEAQTPDTESVAALSAALHLHFSQVQAPAPLALKTSGATAWTQQGRQRAMESRNFGVQNRKR